MWREPNNTRWLQECLIHNTWAIRDASEEGEGSGSWGANSSCQQNSKPTTSFLERAQNVTKSKRPLGSYRFAQCHQFCNATVKYVKYQFTFISEYPSCRRIQVWWESVFVWSSPAYLITGGSTRRQSSSSAIVKRQMQCFFPSGFWRPRSRFMSGNKYCLVPMKSTASQI